MKKFHSHQKDIQFIYNFIAFCINNKNRYKYIYSLYSKKKLAQSYGKQCKDYEYNFQ